ncbi:MAG: hypothetical protein ABR540_20760 [Acidimicrobiales bacterium]
MDPRAQVVAQTDAGLVVGLQWRRRDRRDAAELFQVLRLRDGKIVDMQDCRDRLEALKAIGAAA